MTKYYAYINLADNKMIGVIKRPNKVIISKGVIISTYPEIASIQLEKREARRYQRLLNLERDLLKQRADLGSRLLRTQVDLTLTSNQLDSKLKAKESQK